MAPRTLHPTTPNPNPNPNPSLTLMPGLLFGEEEELLMIREIWI